MDAIERAVPAPQIEIIVQGRAWRQVFRNRAPLAARAQDVHQTVSNLAQVHRALITTRLGRREAWLDQRPLRIGQGAWIAQIVAVIAGTIFGRPNRQRLPQNQAATLESQPIHPIQYLPGQTLRLCVGLRSFRTVMAWIGGSIRALLRHSTTTRHQPVHSLVTAAARGTRRCNPAPYGELK